MTMGARKLAHPNFLQSEGKNQRSRSGADGITGTRSGRLFFRNPRGGCCSPRPTFSPTRRNIETVFELSLPPGQIFRHIRWAETNFKTFLLSSLQLKLSSAVTDPSPDSSHSSHEPRTFLSFFLFFFLTSSKKLLYREKHWLNRGAEGMDDNRLRWTYSVEFVSMSCLREGWFLLR